MTCESSLLALVRGVEHSTDRLLSAVARPHTAQPDLDHHPARERQAILAVASAFQQAPREMLGRGRRRSLVAARTAVAIILREAGYSLPQIGRVLKRDHTTVMHCLSDDCVARKEPGFLERLDLARGARP